MLPSVAIGDTLTAFAGVMGALAACWGHDAGHSAVTGASSTSACSSRCSRSWRAPSRWDPAMLHRPRSGSRVAGGAPRNVYRTRDDRYVAVSGTTDAQRTASPRESSGATMPLPTSASVTRRPARSRRRARRARRRLGVDAPIATTSLGALLAARVPVTPVNDVRDLLDDPRLAARATSNVSTTASLPTSTPTTPKSFTTGSTSSGRGRSRSATVPAGETVITTGTATRWPHRSSGLKELLGK